MTHFGVANLPYNTVLYIHTEQGTLQINPEYQREGDVWPLEKRQLLIDSILNGYDIPKIYFHKFVQPKKIGGRVYLFAIVDGRQRLASIWGFIEGAFSLPDSFEYLPDPTVNAKGLTYKELGKRYPKLKLRFDSYPLPIVAIETDDIDLIDDMFSRLNEAVPLSAPEKRNAFPGPLPKLIRNISKEEFCKSRLPFTNKRYRHYDLLAKFLLIEEENKITDTKKVYLDAFVRRWKPKTFSDAKKSLGVRASKTLSAMSSCFTKQDPLLRSVGMVVLYYHAFRLAARDGWVDQIERKTLKQFEERRLQNRKEAEDDITRADYDLLEFDRLVQSPNDAFAMATRLQVLMRQCFSRDLPKSYFQ